MISIMMPCLYALFQILVLFSLRKYYLLTVYQTAAIYGAVSLGGILLLCFVLSPAMKGYHRGRAQLWNGYLVCWSGLHSVMVLGFMTYGTFYLTLTQISLAQVVNLFLGVLLYWILYLFLGNPYGAIGLGNLLTALVGTLNFYLMKFRGTPFRLSDIRSVRTAGNVAANYDFTPSAFLILPILDMVLWFAVWCLCGRELKRREGAACGGDRPAAPEWKGSRRWNRVNVTISLGCLACCVLLYVVDFPRIYADTDQFASDLYWVTLLMELAEGGGQFPEDYSPEAAREAIEAFYQREGAEPKQGTEALETLPNILVIMNEAFSDLRVLGEFDTDLPVLEHWDAISENAVRGWANVSVYGGITANSEYEFLTSDPAGVYSDRIPYNHYFESSDRYPSLVSLMNELGYESVAFHPYYASGWNRTQVYRAMGFENIIFKEDLEEELDALRIYASDRGDYSFLEKWLEEKGREPVFLFNVTMQNHGGYTYSGDHFQTTVHLTGEGMEGRFPETEQYLSLLRESDEAFYELLSWLEDYEEPVIVLLFGDHQPRLESGFYEALTGQSKQNWGLERYMDLYKTPFLIWHNYDSWSGNIGDVSLNYLASLLLEDAGLPMSGYQRYALEQYRKLPVITELGIKDAAGNIYPKKSQEFKDLTREYRNLVYYHTVDKENRRDDFYRLD